MRFRWEAFKLGLSRKIWATKVAFMRFTWNRFVSPLYIRYATWINRNLGYGYIKPREFIKFPKKTKKFEVEDRYDGIDRHVR